MIATGDGNGWVKNHGFVVALERAKVFGLRPEVSSWSTSLNHRLAAAADVVEILDDTYYGITFIEGGRTSQPIIVFPRDLHLEGDVKCRREVARSRMPCMRPRHPGPGLAFCRLTQLSLHPASAVGGTGCLFGEGLAGPRTIGHGERSPNVL